MNGEYELVHEYLEPEPDDTPEVIKARGSWTLMQHTPRPLPPGEDVAAIREKMLADFTAIVYSDQPGAWLMRHPPGTGKTTQFAEAVGDAFAVQGVVAAAPTIAEAEKLAQAAGLTMLRAQGMDNCAEKRREADLPASQRRLELHLAGGHRGSDYCQGCPHLHACRSTPGEYRHEQEKFSKDAARGIVRVATTVKMLEYLAHTLAKCTKHRLVIWTDEDLFPHLATEVNPVSRDEIDGWCRHAAIVGGADLDIAFMRRVADALTAVRPEGVAGDRIEDHSGPGGCRMLAMPEGVLSDLRAAAMAARERNGTATTHDTERIAEGGAPIPAGHWRRAVFSAVLGILDGACWVSIGKDDQRSLVGYGINRAMVAMADHHAVMQSDATADPAMWQAIWGDRWRGYLDAAPRRSMRVVWEPDSLKAVNADKHIPALVAKAAHAAQAGRVGVVTHKAWEEPLARRLRARGIRTAIIDGDGDPDSALVLVGHYGKHDRGVNHFAGVDHLILAGTFRPPMSVWHQRAGCIQAISGACPAVPRIVAARTTPYGSDGSYLTQAANRGTASADPRTAWVADYERAAHLAQAIERVRSVSRAEQGKPPATVRVWGLDASIPIIAFPLEFDL